MNYALNILLNPDKSKVLMQLKDRSIYAGKYNFPGGKLQLNHETMRNGALRELNEETGVTPDQIPDFQWLGTLTIAHDCQPGREDRNATLIFFAATIDETIPKQQPGETEPLEWRPVNTINQMAEQGMLAGNGELPYFLGEALRAL